MKIVKKIKLQVNKKQESILWNISNLLNNIYNSAINILKRFLAQSELLLLKSNEKCAIAHNLNNIKRTGQ